jgi:multiple sugar transport system ATP-binding protein
MTLGDRIVIMKDGIIQQIGTPQQVFEHPLNIFVAGFIGSPQMNFFDARLEQSGGRYDIHLEEYALELPEDVQKRLKESEQKPQDIVLGIRPEHIMLAENDDAGAITADVDVSEMMGSEVYLHAKVAGKECVLRIATSNLSIERREWFSAGNTLKIRFNSGFIHMFDKATERNILE